MTYRSYFSDRAELQAQQNPEFFTVEAMSQTEKSVWRAIARLRLTEPQVNITIRRLAAEINARSASTAQDALKALQQRGYVTWQPRKPGTLRLLVWPVNAQGRIVT